jgi:NAD-dependent SIR2 family protein deacetylase
MIKKQLSIPTVPIIKLSITPTKTFQCVDCGNQYSINLISKKINTSKPKYCKYCV